MKRASSIALLFAATAIAAGAAWAQPKTVDAVAAGDVVTVTAKVESVDQANRIVVIKGPMGRVIPLQVGDAVKNFAQIKAGDDVVVKYAEAVSVSLVKGEVGRSKTVTTTGPVTAPAGAKPGVAMGKQTTIVASVESVDTKRNVALLLGPQGRYAEVKIKDPQVMKDIKAGDKVEATFIEAVAVEVVAAKK
jgi:Cu/Ag efflux protein CusF